jgi:cytochrome P450
MGHGAAAPFRLGKLRSLPFFASFIADRLAMTRALHRAHGRYVLLQYPWSRRTRPATVPFIADAELYRAVFSAPETWRGVKFLFRGFKGHASDRLTFGMTRLRGARHAHYRRLLAPPLSRPAVAAMSPEMAALADREVSSWPRGVPQDLVPLTEHLALQLAIGLLFGDDRARAIPIAEMIGRMTGTTRLLPGREYFSWLAIATRQERAILEWAEQKRGDLDARDIISIIANNPDETGAPPSPAIIGGILSFAFGAAYETCQNGLAWILIMVAQHPRIAAMLADEIRGALRGSPPTIDRLDALPLLDGVVKEGLRIFPPVPLQSRKSTVATNLGGIDVAPDTRLFASIHVINRNPDIYAEPERFRPERWRDLHPSPHEYGVFGTGGRMCPGFVFAMQMLKISIAAILSRHRVAIAPGARIDYRTRVTLSPYPGVPIVLRDVADAPQLTRITGGIHKLVDLSQAC